MRALCIALLMAGCAREHGAAPTDAAPAMGAKPASMADDEAETLIGSACLGCHGRELVASSRIGLAGWKSEITKMKQWGALVPDEAEAPLAGHLTRRYGPGATEVAPVEIEPSTALAEVKIDSRPVSGDASRGEVAWARACAACHGARAEGSGGGPALVDAPVLWRPTDFARVVRNGRGRMPAFTDIAPDDLLLWLRLQATH
jgi:mono/diheme cytochrome c family protein